MNAVESRFGTAENRKTGEIPVATTTNDDAAKAEKPESGELTPGARLAAQRAAKAAQKAAKKGTAPMVSGAVGERVSRFNEAVQENRKLITSSLLAVAAVVVLATAWNVISSVTSRNAGSALAEAVLVARANMEAEQEQLAGGGQGEEQEHEFAAGKPSPKKVLEKFKQTAASHSGSEAAKWARLGEAGELYAAARYDEAARAYTAALEAAGKDEFVRSRALEGLGFCLEAEKKLDQARERFEQMGALSSGAFKPLADYHVARIYLAQGDKKNAGASLSEVVSSLQSSSSGGNAGRHRYVRFEANARLRELGITPQRPNSTTTTTARGSSGKNAVGNPGRGSQQRDERNSAKQAAGSEESEDL